MPTRPRRCSCLLGNWLKDSQAPFLDWRLDMMLLEFLAQTTISLNHCRCAASSRFRSPDRGIAPLSPLCDYRAPLPSSPTTLTAFYPLPLSCHRSLPSSVTGR